MRVDLKMLGMDKSRKQPGVTIEAIQGETVISLKHE